MGLPVEVNPLLASSTGYNISRSLRFRASASAYLNRTFSSNGSQQTWTWSGWVKAGRFGSQQPLFCAYSSTTNYGLFTFSANAFISATDTLKFYTTISNVTQSALETAAVFRDPSAWYHILLQVDTTQATTNNRVRIYVNGVQQTLSGTQPSQNANIGFYNTTSVPHQIGALASGTYGYYDGYFAEVNFIDGQALTPSSFGQYDGYGIWQPKKYSGTYGTNGFYLPFSNAQTSSYGGSFNGSSQYLTIASNAAFNIFGGDMTAEAWIYPTNLTGRTEHLFAFVQDASNRESVYFNGTTLTFWTSSSGGGSGARITSTAVNQNEWNHVAVVKSGSTFTLYVNGVSQGTSTTTVYSTSNQLLRIGTYDGSNPADNFTGTISNVRIIKGTAAYTSNFIPSSAPLTAVTNTQLLTLQNSTIIDNSANAFTITNTGSITTSVQYPFIANITADYSGNVNNWNANNIGMNQSSTTYDSMLDSPTPYADGGNGRGNYAVMNPLVATASTMSNANLTVTGQGAAAYFSSSTFPFGPTGKWYCEVTCGSVGGAYTPHQFGLGPNTRNTSTSLNIYLNNYGQVDNQNVISLPSGSYTNIQTSGLNYTQANGDIIQFAYDADTGKSWIGINNSWIGTSLTAYNGAPSTGTNPTNTFTANTLLWLFTAPFGSGTAASFNFGQRPFAYTPPTGFKALNTFNLPLPTIPNGAAYMAATLYTGNGSTQTINNSSGFYPDFNWIKNRSQVGSHVLVNSVVGGTKQLFSNLTDAEQTNTNITNGISSSGIALGNNTNGTGSTNQNTNTYVVWQWLAGAGTTSTNTSGSITSTVSVSAQSGFSVVTYTGNGTAGATVGHGLGVAPNLVIWKKRSSTANWFVWSKAADVAAGSTRWGYLNATNAFDTSASTNEYPTYKVDPTSTVFTVNGTGSSNGTNDSSATYVAYCFAEIRGYSAFGSYTGNGSADGTFVYTGFRPRWIMWKRSNASGDGWWIVDSSRDSYNVATQLLFAQSSTTEAAVTTPIDFLSNGFKFRNGADSSINGSGGTYIYMAFAENPFKYARAR